MKKPYFLTLLSKKLRNEISVEEDKQLEHAIGQNNAYKDLANELGGYFRQKSNKTPNVQERLDRTWEMIGRAEETFHAKYDHHSVPVSPLRRFLKIAAMVAIILSAGALSYHAITGPGGSKYDTLRAGRTRIFRTLDDGTRVWLNVNSSLRYNGNFGETTRDVFLNGEAFFDVARNSKIPMVIHARNVDIVVKGTAFNVNAYQGPSDIQVSLIRGSIEVTHRLNNQKVLLKPSEQLIVDDDLRGQAGAFRIIRSGENILSGSLKWTNDSLMFKKEKLKDLAVQLEKKYSVKIEIRDEQLKNKRFSGTFANESLEEALEALKLSYPFSYSIDNKLITIDK